ncbi:MAG: nucleotidyltransferase family protein [Bacteroidaceae bacterium]|nr:nucleotidyltransferase family protein [Bacteroidaceae bacterium]
MDLLVELLQVALGNKKELSEKASNEEWESLFEKAKQQTITGVLFGGIEQLPESQRPERVFLLKWYAYVERLEKRNDKMNYYTRNVMMRFMMDGFRAIVLKGQGNAFMYPNPRRRHPGDIDLWLTVPGKTPREGRDDIVKYALKYTPEAQVLYHHTVFDVLKKSEGVEIEPHYMPTWLNNPFKNRILQKWFEDQVPIQFENNKIELPGDVGEIYVPTRDFNITFQLLHIYRHLYSDGIGLRQVIDYYYLLTSKENNVMPEIIKKLGLDDFGAALMYVLENVCGMDKKYMFCEPHIKHGKFLLNEIMMAGNFGLYDPRNPYNIRENLIQRLYRRQKRNLNFIHFYPSEIIWGIYFTIWQRLWRVKKGYTTLFGK